MADSVTPRQGFVQPEVGLSKATWGTKLNNNWAMLDALLGNANTPGEYMRRDGAVMTGQLGMFNNKIVGLAAPTASTDAAHKLYVDNQIASAKSYTDGKISDTKAYADSIVAPVSAKADANASTIANIISSRYTKVESDARYLLNSGQRNMNGRLNLISNDSSGGILLRGYDGFDNNRIVATIFDDGSALFASTITAEQVPTLWSHLTNKKYVDDSIAAGLAGRTLTAGDGLDGGGSLSADRDFAVDSTVLRTSGTQSRQGRLNLTGSSNIFFIGGAGWLGGRRQDNDLPKYGIFSLDTEAFVRFRAYDHINTGTYYDFKMTWDGRFYADKLYGDGSEITNIDGRKITVGPIPEATISPAIVRTSRQILAGAGIIGGGNMSNDRAFALGTPSKITRTSINEATGNTHTHAILRDDFRDMLANWMVAGQIGSMIFGTPTDGAAYSFGSTISGSLLRPSNAAGIDGSTSFSGTWTTCGASPAGTADGRSTTLWQRIA